jgi:hypothetical protein
MPDILIRLMTVKKPDDRMILCFDQGNPIIP